jgi:hypothetical protein
VANALTNNSAESEQNFDTAIREQFDLLKKSEGALTVVGGLLAQACADGAYPADAWVAAHRAYQMRGVSGKSSHAQISKLANFAYVALAWDRKGIWDDVKQTILAINGQKLTAQSRHEQQMILLECVGKLHELLCKRAGVPVDGSQG